MHMHTLQPAAVLVVGFIEDFWNGRQFHKAGDYFHAGYRDHSVPPNFPAGPAGTIRWIEAMGESFIHRTQIEEVITEAGTVVLRVRLHLKHTGPWRGIEATGAEVSTTGFRVFRVEAGKIAGHLALIDGESLEKQLKGLTKGCALPA
jgi:predicted SnoaL-like aldol condensation-catalyzing enzyme